MLSYFDRCKLVKVVKKKRKIIATENLKKRKVIFNIKNDDKVLFIKWVLLHSAVNKDVIEIILGMLFVQPHNLKEKYTSSISNSIRSFPGHFYGRNYGRFSLQCELWGFKTNVGKSPQFCGSNCIDCGNYINWDYDDDEDGCDFYGHKTSSPNYIRFYLPSREITAERLFCLCQRDANIPIYAMPIIERMIEEDANQLMNEWNI